MATLEELLGQTETQKETFSLEELLRQQRPTFSLEELHGKQTEILAKAQEKVKWIKEMDSPSEWKEEVWSTAGETMKETPGAEFFSKEFWTETGKNLVKQSVEAIKEETIGRGKRWLTTMPKLMTFQLPGLGKIAPGMEAPPPGKMGVEAGRGALDFVLFIPKTAFNLAKDPINTIKNNPLDVLILVGATAGAKRAKMLKSKIAKQKGWVMTGDYIDPLVESKMISKQLKKRLLEVPPDIELEVPIGEPLEIVKFKKNGKIPVFKHHWDGFKRDLAKTGDIPDRPLKYGKYAGMRIPLRTFEQYPWLKRVLYDEWRTGEFNALMEHTALKDELKTWRKKIPKKSQERVGIYADYMQEGGAEIMKFMKKKLPELTPAEMQYYHWGQKVFNDFLPRLNQMRALAGEKPIGKVSNYSTWIRNLGELADLGIDISKATAEQIEFHLNSLPLSMAKHRAPGLLKAGVELNYGLLLENYSRQATRNIHISPAVIKARAFLEPFTKQNWHMFEKAPRLATWLEQWTDTIAGQSRAIPKGVAGKYVRVMNSLNKNIAMAILSYNVRSALIQPSAFKLSYVFLGEKYLVQGFMKNLSKESRAFAAKNSQHLIMRKKGMYDIHAAMIHQAQLGKKFAGTKQAIAQAGMMPLQWFDYQTAQATWLGAYEMATKKLGMKKNSRRAFTYADDVIVKTQASAQIGDIAPIQRTPMGRFATLFQTFVINEWDMLTHDVLGYKNPYMNMASRSKNIARFTLGSAVVNAVYEGIFKIRSPYPAPEFAWKRGVEEGWTGLKTAGAMGRELMEQLPVLGGVIRWSTPYRTAWPAFIQTGFVEPVQMINRLLEKPKLTKDQLEWVGKILGIPATSQVLKYFRRRKKGMSHAEAIIGIRTEGEGKKKSKKYRW